MQIRAMQRVLNYHASEGLSVSASLQKNKPIERGETMAMTLKAARVNSGLTQVDAAKLLGISVDTLRSWEKSKTFPDVQNLKNIEKLYGVSYNDLNFLPLHSA